MCCMTVSGFGYEIKCVFYISFFLCAGLKPGQRKVLFSCFKRNDKREVKVAQLAGSVAEMSAYHHGEVGTMKEIRLQKHGLIAI